MFDSLNVRIESGELERFMDHFWKSEKAGIDYAGFLRIFSKYQVKHDRDQKVRGAPKIVSDTTIRVKKELYDKMHSAFQRNGNNLQDLFQAIDVDKSQKIEFSEFEKMIRSMKISFNGSQQIMREIFDSIDVDGSGELTLPEIQADFNFTVQTSVEQLLMQNQSNKKMAQQAGMSQEQYSEIENKTRLSMVQAQSKVLQSKISIL